MPERKPNIRNHARPKEPEMGSENGSKALVVKGVTKVYPNGFKALESTDLSLNKGDFLTIVGPSGCGKSTLLRMVAGLLTPTEGSIITPGLKTKKGNLGFVFQDAHLLPWRTTQKNVELLLEVTGVPKEDRTKLAIDTLAKVGLKGFENAYPRQLSGGMKMRVSLARTLVLSPKIFLMDEPFAAVDEMTRHALNEDFLQLHHTEGFTALFVTHSVSEAVFMSNRVVVMTCNPGFILAEIAVPFSIEERTPELRNRADFAELCGIVSKRLWEGV